MVVPISAASSKSAARSVEDGQKSLQMLVVDDDPDLCMLLQTALVALGCCDVEVGHGAKAALLALDRREEPFDGIFLDIQMPGTSGIELCSIIRATPGYRNVPIIMLTAMSEQHFLRDAFAAGANDYITKPYDFTDMRFRLFRERMKSNSRQGLSENSRSPSVKGTRGRGEVIINLSDAVHIPRVDRCIKKEAFDNYVLKMAAGGGSEIYVRVTKIATVDTLFSAIAVTDFQSVVEEVARLLSVQSAVSGDLISYTGNGVFFSLSIGKSGLKLMDLAKSLRNSPALGQVIGAHNNSLRLILGREIPVSRKSKKEVLSSLLSALDAAETTEARNFGWRSYREWLSTRRSLGREQKRLQEAEYKHMLDDILVEGERGHG